MRDQPRESLAALKAAVAVMGLLIVLGTALVVGVIIHRVYARNTAAASMPAVSPPVCQPVGGALGRLGWRRVSILPGWRALARIWPCG